ncbi:hypothetical protein CsSME_00025948 [Camellia sinensis var. sinensis]
MYKPILPSIYIQKIVIQMQLSRDKDRSKAMQITSLTKGVSSVAIKGDGKDQAEVIGEQIDSVELTKSIRRKVSKYASVQSVEERNHSSGLWLHQLFQPLITVTGI